MVMRISVARTGPVLLSVFALFLVAALPGCSQGWGGLGQSSSDNDGGPLASSLALKESGAGDFLAGSFAFTQHDLQVAPEYLLKALAFDPENKELLQRSLLALAADGRMDDAAEIARRLLRFDSDSPIAVMMVVEQDAKRGRWADVEHDVAPLPRHGLAAFMAPIIVAWAREAQGDTDGALKSLEPLAHASAFAALHDFHAALICDLADRREQAGQFYRRTLDRENGQTLRTVEAAVAFYRRTGQAEEAEKIEDLYRKNHPDTPPFDAAGLAARPVASATSGLAEAFFAAAGSWRQGNVPELALVFGRMAVDLEPDFSLAQISLGDVLQQLGRLRDANKVFAGIDPKDPVYEAAQLRIADNLDELGDTEGAIKMLEEQAARHPDQPDALVALGDVFRRHERWIEAAGAYNRALAISSENSPDLWALYYSRGIVLERSKQWPVAESDFLKSLELRPDEPHVLNYLGYSWIDQGVNIERARRMIETAVKLRPNDGYIVDSLGWAYYRSGFYAKAADTLERAVELHPEDPTINDHLGDALWMVGREEEARFQWQHALVSKPDPELAAQIQKKLNGEAPVLPETRAGVKSAGQ